MILDRYEPHKRAAGLECLGIDCSSSLAVQADKNTPPKSESSERAPGASVFFDLQSGHEQAKIELWWVAKSSGSESNKVVSTCPLALHHWLQE